MRRLSSCCRRRCLAKAGAGRVDGTLYAVGEGCAQHTAKYRVSAAECAAEHHSQRRANVACMCNQNNNRNNQIANGHERNDNRRELCDAAHAAGNDHEQQNCNNQTNNPVRSTKAVFHCHCNVICGRTGYEERNANGCTKGKQYSEDFTKRLNRNTMLHVEVWAAAVLTVHADFIQLTKAVLCECNRGSYQSGNNHPNDCARAAIHNGYHDASDVANRYAVCSYRTERLKGRQSFFRTLTLCEKFPLQFKLCDVAKLNCEAIDQGKTKRQNNQRSSPQNVVNLHNQCRKIHFDFLLSIPIFFSLLTSRSRPFQNKNSPPSATINSCVCRCTLRSNSPKKVSYIFFRGAASLPK